MDKNQNDSAWEPAVQMILNCQRHYLIQVQVTACACYLKLKSHRGVFFLVQFSVEKMWEKSNENKLN